MLVDEAVRSHAQRFDDDKENNENLKIFNGVSHLVKKERENNKPWKRLDEFWSNHIENNKPTK